MKYILACLLLFFSSKTWSSDYSWQSSFQLTCLALSKTDSIWQPSEAEAKIRYKRAVERLRRHVILRYFKGYELLDPQLQLTLFKYFSHFYIPGKTDDKGKISLPEAVVFEVRKLVPEGKTVKQSMTKTEFEELLLAFNYRLALSFTARFEAILPEGISTNEWEDRLQTAMMGLTKAFQHYAQKIIIGNQKLPGQEKRPAFSSVAWNSMKTLWSRENYITPYVAIPQNYFWTLKAMEDSYFELVASVSSPTSSAVAKYYLSKLSEKERKIAPSQKKLANLWEYYFLALQPPSLIADLTDPSLLVENDVVANSFISMFAPETPQLRLETQEEKALIREALETFVEDKRSLYILQMAHGIYRQDGKEMTYGKIASEIFHLTHAGILEMPVQPTAVTSRPLSVERIRQMHAQALRKLRSHIRKFNSYYSRPDHMSEETFIKLTRLSNFLAMAADQRGLSPLHPWGD